MTRTALAAALACLVCGCASTEPPPHSETFRDPRAEALEQAVAKAAADEGGAVARRTTLEVESVEDVGEHLMFDLRIVRERTFKHPEQEFIVIARCPKASPDVCRDNAMAARRAAAMTE